jgi:hypothetical protein
VSLLQRASISARTGRRAAFVLPILAAASFGLDCRAEPPDPFFHPAPLATAHKPLLAPAPLQPQFENYAERTPRPSKLSPEFDFGSSLPLKEYPLQKERSDDMLGRVPLNGGSFGIDAEQKLDFKKVAPGTGYIESNIEKHERLPFVGFSIVAPYNSELVAPPKSE